MDSERQHWEPVEIITAERTGVRVCVFRDADGTYAFELQRHETTAAAAGSRYLERWMNIGIVAMSQMGIHNTDRLGFGEFDRALGQAASALIALAEAEEQREER